MSRYNEKRENENNYHGIIFHVHTTSEPRYGKALIHGEWKEVTMFDGYFQNMLSEHQDVKCIGIIVGYFDLKPNSFFSGEGRAYEEDSSCTRYILGLGYSRDFYIAEEDAFLTEEVMRAYQEKQIKEKNTLDYKRINKSVMDNTQELCGCLDYLKKAIVDSISREYIVRQEDVFELTDMTANEDMKIIVSKERTFEAAEKYKGNKICCLDFANCHSVGGSPWYAGAQEESMCRISTLYPCIYAKKEEFYEKHILKYQARKIDDMGTDDIIYVPDVVVFKTDESIPKLKEESSWFKTDVIVCAAPELDWEYDETRYRNIMESRIKRILDVAAKEKVKVLILGAFGCGAFNNPPEIVSDIFASLIRLYDFEVVEFAVFCRNDTTNFDVFKQRLSEGGEEV